MRRILVVAAVLGAVVALAVLGGLFAPHDPSTVVGPPYSAPGEAGLLGTDGLGRDVLSRVLAGGSDLVLVSLLAALIATTTGVAGGLLAGWSDGWTARTLTSSADVLLAAPQLLIALVAAVALPGPAAVVIATVCGGTPLTLRVVRDATRLTRGAGFVEAARCRGERGPVLLAREVLPSLSGLVTADAGMRFVMAIQLASALSLLGFGTQPPQADWALMIRENLPGSGLNAAGVLAPALVLAVVAGAMAATAAHAGRRTNTGRQA
ncbi:ABC transporter permease [Prauserella marina]|uniref:Peptide/nickel transport system permease protein n=1 Tax=Prauserella marina TaxID=530584 RepID=A0A222VPI1_9PSEU|nr:ABC transporter permease subunit [Prauserella marina]ASR35794.1 ABC transporter permease [Prauserella marina]PWV84306.1 peptide/nickel transport system permease protein [Prauserella marina]SDC25738.1 peptide/nickel transport system permease protein [Prauserella marina]